MVGSADVGGINAKLPGPAAAAGHRISGTVTDTAGTPLAGILVSAFTISAPSTGNVTSTASDGTYSVGGLAAGSYRVQFADPTKAHLGGFYTSTGITADAAAATPVVVGSADVGGINAKLPGPTAVAKLPVTIKAGIRPGVSHTGTFVSGQHARRPQRPVRDRALLPRPGIRREAHPGPHGDEGRDRALEGLQRADQPPHRCEGIRLLQRPREGMAGLPGEVRRRRHAQGQPLAAGLRLRALAAGVLRARAHRGAPSLRGPRGADWLALVAWAPAIAWAGLIFALSAQPGLRFAPDEGLDFVVRKLGHMAVFGILALLLWRALAATTAWRRPWAWAFALTTVYALTDELHQAFVATRHPSLVDVGIDAAGALIALVAAAIVRSRRS